MIENLTHNCMEAYDTNLTFQKTFEFIRAYGVSEYGYIADTTLYLKYSLTNFQTPLSKDPRESASNTVSGIVNSVTKTNVVILAKAPCDNKYTEYTVEYSSIIQLTSSAVGSNFNEYLKLLDTLPPLCVKCNNQYTDMLKSLKRALKKYENDETKVIKLIFDQVNSKTLLIKDIVIKKNFIIAQSIFIIPITSISGYIIKPQCENQNDKPNVE